MPTIQDRVDQRVMVMKEYSIFPRVPELERHHQIQFSVIPKTLAVVGGVLPLYKVVFYHPKTGRVSFWLNLNTYSGCWNSIFSQYISIFKVSHQGLMVSKLVQQINYEWVQSSGGGPKFQPCARYILRFDFFWPSHLVKFLISKVGRPLLVSLNLIQCLLLLALLS